MVQRIKERNGNKKQYYYTKKKKKELNGTKKTKPTQKIENIYSQKQNDHN